MKIIGVGSLMFLIAASLLSERLQVFFSAQRYTSISTSLLYGCFESEKKRTKTPSRKCASWKKSRVRQLFKFWLKAIFSPQVELQVLRWYK